MSDVQRLRAILAKPGLDGHDRGAKVVARGLRDAGFEVIYTGLRQTPHAIAVAAMQENVDVICLSILSGAHVGICARLHQEQAALGTDVPVVVGGIIPDDDRPALKASGVRAIFGPGSGLPDICREVRRIAEEYAGAPAE
ncbi:cobalamin B12-binding domain-containing protein [Blastococcus saxobsidens]|uniref:Methylmalonyl-CoA mutase small subunit n=1 Tax=Blastococcus saxobsidens (strain DD2) TaxID=1146883 RepID=H6RNM0_BLASD|nr:cobalamin B12-binding domain-containing protein [Blastococcus saxobsidens]CCG05168.1 Methylmalonyl-CoA mutase small subunit [Blastococcus saxobsidens DD2]